jgi:ABC-type multidrug transport system permease subunit
MALGALVKKEFRLLLRDRLSTGILLLMPLLCIAVLGLLLGEGFGQKTDNRLRVSLVNLDQGHGSERWSQTVQQDLIESDVRVELIGSVEEAKALVDSGRRSAVFVFGPHFSERVHECSFLAEGINPFFRDGVDIGALDAELLRDPTQKTGAAIIEQVGQVTLLRVILPWMIGRAFAKLGDPSFLSIMAAKAKIPRFLLTEKFKKQMGEGIKESLKELFPKYNLTGTTWASLTKAEPREGKGTPPVRYANEGGSGLLNRGAARYQILVPSYTVLFCFALILTVGWLFVTERRQGTLRRLRAAPVRHDEVLLGKLLPCLALSVFQGFFLLLAGKLVFAMSWGPASWPVGKQLLLLAPVVVTTSFAAMGLAMLVAAVARTEMQVAILGSLLFLFLGLISGCLIPRELMPETMTDISHITPHAWALDAYRQLLVRPTPGTEITPNLTIVRNACLVLCGFGAGFLALAWGFLRLD